jgi:hypothetical protein
MGLVTVLKRFGPFWMECADDAERDANSLGFGLIIIFAVLVTLVIGRCGAGRKEGEQ